MSSEYIKLSQPEIFYGKKNSLQAQVELLQTLQRYKNYEQLRKEEFVLKITLKNKVEEVLSCIQLLDKLLPKTLIKDIKEDSFIDTFMFQKEKASLAQEIEEIKQKLARLH